MNQKIGRVRENAKMRKCEYTNQRINESKPIRPLLATLVKGRFTTFTVGFARAPVRPFVYSPTNTPLIRRVSSRPCAPNVHIHGC